MLSCLTENIVVKQTFMAFYKESKIIFINTKSIISTVSSFSSSQDSHVFSTEESNFNKSKTLPKALRKKLSKTKKDSRKGTLKDKVR